MSLASIIQLLQNIEPEIALQLSVAEINAALSDAANASGGSSAIFGQSPDYTDFEQVVIDSNENNYPLTTKTGWKMTATGTVAARSISGIIAPNETQIRTIVNVTPDKNIRLFNNNNNSIEENRFLTPNNVNFIIRPNMICKIIYLKPENRWFVLT